MDSYWLLNPSGRAAAQWLQTNAKQGPHLLAGASAAKEVQRNGEGRQRQHGKPPHHDGGNDLGTRDAVTVTGDLRGCRRCAAMKRVRVTWCVSSALHAAAASTVLDVW